jgi:hypothetical protein
VKNAISTPLIIFDDREFTDGEVFKLVGRRRFGEIIFKRRPLIDHLIDALPDWARENFILIRDDNDLMNLRRALMECDEDTSVFLIAARAAFLNSNHLNQLIERLPFAIESFTDKLYSPLIIFLKSAHELVRLWPEFAQAPIHSWEQSWSKSQRLESVAPLDLSEISNFLTFTSGSTAARYFNEVQIDPYYYTKRSADKDKMRSEYLFYGLVPERVRPWLIQPFDFQDEGERASYRMLRYYLADAALQWIHGAFNAKSFEVFIKKLLFFLAERPTKPLKPIDSSASAQELFVRKLEVRVKQFISTEGGGKINRLAVSVDPQLDIERQLNRFLGLYQILQKKFSLSYCAVGHGDLCFSNILYDQQSGLIRLIDPKGALKEGEIWTYPLYDLCKLSHSVLGDYDFINNGQFRLEFNDDNKLELSCNKVNQDILKRIFIQCLEDEGYDIRLVRLGEASLFLSMLPLHIDHPNKTLAFMIRASNILDEVESGYGN